MTINMPRHLHEDQFGALASDMETRGGFTIKAFGPDAGLRGRDMLSVGGMAPGRMIPAPTRASDIESYTQEHRAALSKPGANLGGWQETNTERALDVSQQFSRTPAGHAGARGMTLAKNEKAYGELDASGDYAGEHHNPFSTRGLGEHGVAGHVNRLKADPGSYESVVSGDVMGGMQRWVRGPQRRQG